MAARGSQPQRKAPQRASTPKRGGGPAGTGSPGRSVGEPGTGGYHWLTGGGAKAPSATQGRTRYTSGAAQAYGPRGGPGPTLGTYVYRGKVYNRPNPADESTGMGFVGPQLAKTQRARMVAGRPPGSKFYVKRARKAK